MVHSVGGGRNEHGRDDRQMPDRASEAVADVCHRVRLIRRETGDAADVKVRRIASNSTAVVASKA